MASARLVTKTAAITGDANCIPLTKITFAVGTKAPIPAAIFSVAPSGIASKLIATALIMIR